MRDLLAVFIIGGDAVFIGDKVVRRVGVDLGALNGFQLDIAHDGVINGDDLTRGGRGRRVVRAFWIQYAHRAVADADDQRGGEDDHRNDDAYAFSARGGGSL